MTNRKEEQGDEAISKIKKEASEQGKEVKVEWVGCDLGSLKEVKEVFTGLRDRLDRLDLVSELKPGKAGRWREVAAKNSPQPPQLILSAGINSNQYGLDNDGYDRHFGVSCFAQPFDGCKR